MRTHFTILISLFIINSPALSQADFYARSREGVRNRIDSLMKLLPALKDAARIDCLNELSSSHLTFNNDTAGYFAGQALKESEQINDITGKAKAYKNLGRIKFISMEDFRSAEKYFDMSLRLLLQSGDVRQIAWAWGV